MKIALVHDYIKEFGGAERVLAALCEIFPEAPIYTSFCVKNSTAGKAFAGKKIITSGFDRILQWKNLYSPLRFLTPFIWQSFDLSDYDLVIISSSWYMARGFKIGPKTKVICYCHTPPRYLYGYPTSIEWQRYWPVKIYASIVNHFLRMYDFSTARKVDYFIANSKNVAERIKKFYKREATVIYPPVEVEKIRKATESLRPKSYLLVVSRIVGAKGIEMATEAAKNLKIPLKIVGEPAGLKWFGKNLDSLKNEWVEFVGRVSDEKMFRLYGECQAFLALAVDEDFGITPVEAMASGRPVIAFRGGGYLETVVENETGLFYDEPTVESLIKTMEKFKSFKFKMEDCQKQAEKFEKERFKEEIKEFVKKYAGTSRS